jgi:hypothetical protein
MFKKVKWNGLGHNERYINLPIRIGLFFFTPANPDFKIVRIRLLNLINLPILDFQDQ